MELSPARGESVQPETRFARSEPIVFTDLGDTVVMMDVEQGCYYELDPVGAAIWALAESGPRVSEVCAALVAQYDVAPDTCGNEVRSFLDEMRRHELIRILPDARGNGSDETPGAAPTRPASTGAAALPRQAEGSGRAAWTTPAIRILETIRQVASGPTYEATASENSYYRITNS